jgi:RNA polymerase sigma factor (sigma-70 family)
MVLGAREGNSPQGKAELDRLVRRYWKPVWWYLVQRWRCSPEDAADLTQEFFARLSEENILRKASPERGRFRTFLKLELRDLVVDDLRRRTAQKRAPKQPILPIEDGDVLRVKWPGLSPEEQFDHVWAANLVSSALNDLGAKLKAEGREKVFQAYLDCAVADPPKTYKEVADATGLSVNDVGHYVFRARAELRKILLGRVLECVADAGEAEEELDYIMKLFQR